MSHFWILLDSFPHQANNINQYLKQQNKTKYAKLVKIVGLHIQFLNNHPGISQFSYIPLDFPRKRPPIVRIVTVGMITGRLV